MAIKNKIIAKHEGEVEPEVIDVSLRKIQDKYLPEFDIIYDKLG